MDELGWYAGIGKGWSGLRVGRLVRESELFVGAFVLTVPGEGNGATFVDEDVGGDVFGLGVEGGGMFGFIGDGGGVAIFGGAPDESVGGSVRMTLGS